jgi:hypothetical protein
VGTRVAAPLPPHRRPPAVAREVGCDDMIHVRTIMICIITTVIIIIISPLPIFIISSRPPAQLIIRFLLTQGRHGSAGGFSPFRAGPADRERPRRTARTGEHLSLAGCMYSFCFCLSVLFLDAASNRLICKTSDQQPLARRANISDSTSQHPSRQLTPWVTGGPAAPDGAAVFGPALPLSQPSPASPRRDDGFCARPHTEHP